MAFSPDGRGLTCGYCDRQLSLYQAIQEGAMIEERDFAVALATAKGHSHTVTVQAFTCQGCGAPFILGPAVLSLTCPYCGSAYVIEERQTRQIIPPEAVIPFALTVAQIRDPFAAWLKAKKLLNKCQVERPRGLYLPVWTFDIAGNVTANVRGYRSDSPGVKMPSQTLERPVFYNDIPVVASHRLSPRLAEEVGNFQLDQLVPYDPGYLADWPADTYQISAAEASLVARQRAWQEAREIVGAQLKDQLTSPFGGGNLDMTLNSSNLYVEAFKLILVPLWLIRYHYQNQPYDVVVNGQNGHIRGQTPGGGLRRWLGGLLRGD
jgi:DNA-directed RNA polymerase subunit RPC12/RpoP